MFPVDLVLEVKSHILAGLWIWCFERWLYNDSNVIQFYLLKREGEYYYI